VALPELSVTCYVALSDLEAGPVSEEPEEVLDRAYFGCSYEILER